ncbi:MAG: translation elongation factor Ts [Clostridia bacterium]|nr:translation elongation factor Ts [Clostridia bacterium]MBR7159667.1 translation elongation factor Ts [Clostridia bacterium]
MAFTAQDVMTLRDRTGVGVMDCKKALIEADGNMDKAIEILREKGKATAAKKEGRIASQGIVDSYIHMGGKIGVLLEVNCETDFVAKSPQFKEFVHNVAMHIAAANPQYITDAEVPADVVEKEKEITRAQIANDEKMANKPAQIIEKMVEGKIAKFFKDVCLMDQMYVRDPSKSIRDLLTESIATIGEKISIRRFVRYEMGEGLAKREDNFADEVMAQVNKLQK